MVDSIVIDENLSPKLKNQLFGLFSSITHVSYEGLASSLDIEVWEYAKEHNMAILTKDTDFKSLSSLFGCPPKVVRINCGNRTTNFISKLLASKREIIKNFLADDIDCYLEVT